MSQSELSIVVAFLLAGLAIFGPDRWRRRPIRFSRSTAMPPSIRLGDLARDTITDFTGVAIARTEWLNGCWRVTLQPRELKDGKPIESQTFDVEQLALVEPRHHVAKKETGGPRPEPVRR